MKLLTTLPLLLLPVADATGTSLPVAITDAEVEAARVRRDLVMPRLWASGSDATSTDPLVSEMVRYAAGDARVWTPSSLAAEAPEGVGVTPASEPDPPGPAYDASELTLVESIETALQHNLGIQVVRLSRDAVETDVAAAKAKFYPFLGLGAGVSETEGDSLRTKGGDLNAFVTQEVPTGGTLSVSSDLMRAQLGEEPREYGANVTVSVVQPLLRGGRFYVSRQEILSAEYDLEVAEAQLRRATLRVIAAAKSAYYNVILAEDIIRVTEEAIERDHALIEASQALFDAGLVTMRDVFSARILLASDQARLAEARADHDLARQSFFDTIGLPIASPIDLVDKEIEADPIELDPDGWVATAVEHRPEVLEVLALMDRTKLDIRVARNSIYPQLDFVGSYGWFEDGAPSHDEAFRLHKEEWSAGLVLGIPVGVKAERAATRRAQLEYRGLERLLEDTKRRIELEVRASAIKLRSSLERVEAAEVGVDQAQGKLEIAKERFALGLATNRDITDAQEELLGSETELLTAIVDYNVGLAELEASVAGPI